MPLLEEAMTRAEYQTPEGMARYWRDRKRVEAGADKPWDKRSIYMLREALDWVVRYWRDPITALDYGAGWGKLVPELDRVAHEVHTADVSPECAEHTGGMLVDALGRGLTGQYDLVLLHSVLIHLPDAIATAVFEAIRCHLTMSGRVVLGEGRYVLEPRFAAEHDPETVFWCYPRTVAQIEAVTGMQCEAVFPSPVVYLVMR